MDWRTLGYNKALEGALFPVWEPLGPLIHILRASFLDSLSPLEDGKQLLSCKQWLNYNWSNQIPHEGSRPKRFEDQPRGSAGAKESVEKRQKKIKSS